MKLLNHPIEMIAVFDIDGKITPAKFRYEDKVVRVEKIIKRQKEKLAGNERWVFTCMHQQNYLYELKYEIDTQKWFLFKK